VKPGFRRFIRSENGIPKGFCIDVFEEVIGKLPYKVPKHYVEFGNGKGESNGTYDELVYKVYLKVCMDLFFFYFIPCYSQTGGVELVVKYWPGMCIYYMIKSDLNLAICCPCCSS